MQSLLARVRAVIIASCDELFLDPPGISEDGSDLEIFLDRLSYDDLKKQT